MAIIARRTLTPEAQAARTFADAALAVAGHEITDPALIDLLDRHAAGVIDDAEFEREVDRLIPLS